MKTSRIDIIGSNGSDGLHYKRICSMCHTEKALIEFSRSSKPGSNGYQYHCKSCSAEYKRAHKARIKKVTQANHGRDYRKGLLRAARHRAKCKNIPFNITTEDLEKIDICPVLGIPIFTHSLNNPNAPSIDRIIPALGYVKGNVKIISRRANTLKGDATVDEIKKVLTYVQTNI